MKLHIVGRVVTVVLIVSILMLTAVRIVAGPFEYDGHVDQIVAEAPHNHPSAPATPTPDPNYIVVEKLGLQFTETAYHQRVRDQIEDEGWSAICVSHLGTLVPEARYLSVNSARQNLVYVTECAAADIAREAFVP